MAVVPAAALGMLVVFGIGYVLTHVVAGKIEEKIEEGKRKRSGLIPLVSQTTLDVNAISIAGGILAVALVLILIFAVPRESKGLIWYVLTGIGIVFGILTFFLFGSESRPTASTKTPSGPGFSQNRQTSRDVLYQRLLSMTKNSRDLADRLIEYERKHKPNASEEELIKSAIERWERDNR